MSRSALEKSMRQQVVGHIYSTDPSIISQTWPAASYSSFYAEYGVDVENEEEQITNALPMYGNVTNYNINILLFNNIMENDYFRALFELRTYHEVISEIQRSVKHVEAWQVGTARYPSTAFCLLVKFLVMKLTFRQMNGLLKPQDCVYVRAIGFLYLRYTCPPNDLWKWFEPYLEDEQIIAPAADKTSRMTVGQYCVKLLTEMQYYGTTLPRIPVLIERKMKVMLLLLEERKKRRKENLKWINLFKVGVKVRAIYGDEENEPAWYDAVIDEIVDDSVTSFIVTFPEYGNSEKVDLGDMELVEKPGVEPKEKNREAGRKERSRSRSRERSISRSKSPVNTHSNLMEKVLKSEREASAAVGKQYGQRPTSYKGSLSLKQDRYTVRRNSPEYKKRPRSRSRSRSRGRSRPRTSDKTSTETENFHYLKDSAVSQTNSRLKQLKEIYGDASSSR